MGPGLISIIIPCRSRDVRIKGLLEDLDRQEGIGRTEVIRIDGVSPPGKARNAGAAKASGGVFVFLDSDIRLEGSSFIRNLADAVTGDENIGLVCASIKVPPGSSSFQRRYAEEVPHSESPEVAAVTDVQVVSSACFAARKEVFNRSGGFNEDILRGEDSVLTDKVNKMGYRTVIIPRTRCYHPQPAGFCELIRMNFRNGNGACFVDTFYPELNLDVHPKGVTSFSGKKSIAERARRYAADSLKALTGLRMLLIASKFFYGAGYLAGVISFRLFRRRERE